MGTCTLYTRFGLILCYFLKIQYYTRLSECRELILDTIEKVKNKWNKVDFYKQKIGFICHHYLATINENKIEQIGMIQILWHRGLSIMCVDKLSCTMDLNVD